MSVDNVDSMRQFAGGRWFLTLLQYGPNDPRTTKALDHARRLGVDEETIAWSMTEGVGLAERQD